MATLKKFTRHDPAERVAYSLPLSVRRDIAQYQLYYRQVHGDAVKPSELVEQLLRVWFEQDADYAKWVRTMTADSRAEVEKALGGQADA